MELNISHRSKQEILSTSSLTRPDLFHNALNEIIQRMKTVSSLGSKQFDKSFVMYFTVYKNPMKKDQGKPRKN